jgi:hypothetical protein
LRISAAVGTFTTFPAVEFRPTRKALFATGFFFVLIQISKWVFEVYQMNGTKPESVSIAAECPRQSRYVASGSWATPLMRPDRDPDKQRQPDSRAHNFEGLVAELRYYNARVVYLAWFVPRTLIYSANADDGSGLWLYAIDVERRQPGSLRTQSAQWQFKTHVPSARASRPMGFSSGHPVAHEIGFGSGKEPPYASSGAAGTGACLHII